MMPPKPSPPDEHTELLPATPNATIAHGRRYGRNDPDCTNRQSGKAIQPHAAANRGCDIAAHAGSHKAKSARSDTPTG